MNSFKNVLYLFFEKFYNSKADKYQMTSFKLTTEILNRKWDYSSPLCTTPPITEYWHNKREITIDDVTIWEEIYYQPGNIGVYCSYSPYTEFYIIVYEMFLNTPYGIVTYSGPDVLQDVYDKIKELGIELPVNQIYI